MKVDSVVSSDTVLTLAFFNRQNAEWSSEEDHEPVLMLDNVAPGDQNDIASFVALASLHLFPLAGVRCKSEAQFVIMSGRAVYLSDVCCFESCSFLE